MIALRERGLRDFSLVVCCLTICSGRDMRADCGSLYDGSEFVLHVGSLGFRPDDWSVVLTAEALGLWLREIDVRAFRTSSEADLSRSFQPESLILAQNERWRQA
jgi:hypothetical protein